jgi:CheY-like chemotaxis protein
VGGETAPPISQDERGGNMKTTKILIVEDDSFSRGAMEKLLQSSGYETQSCADAEEALTSLNGEPFNILITDLHMPGMDGFELIRKAKLIEHEIKTILMTGLVTEEVKEKAIAEEIDGIFSKPIAWEKLFAFLGILSGSKRIGSYHYSQGPSRSKGRPLFKGIALAFVLFLLTLFNIHYSEAEESFYAQYRPTFRSEIRKDCLKSLLTILTEEQLNAIRNLQNSFYTETVTIRRDLMISNIEFHQLISDPKIDPKVLLDRQKKILELQSRLERLSLSYQMKARSIFTNEQLDRLPWDCALGMRTSFGINVGIGRGPRRGYRR